MHQMVLVHRGIFWSRRGPCFLGARSYASAITHSARFCEPVLALVIRSCLCGTSNRPPIRAVTRLHNSRGRNADGADSMNKTNDALWLAFEALAKTYPHYDGVRMTADPARYGYWKNADDYSCPHRRSCRKSYAL
jgi:hypothetical protein